MRLKEWPLVVFTLVTQMAVGLLLAAAVLHLAGSRRYCASQLSALTGPALPAVVALLAVAALAALFHLGRPLRALKAIANLRTSWLSREMLAAALFGLVAGMCALLRVFRPGPSAAQTALIFLAAMAGIALVVVLSRLYMLRTVPSWNTPVTLLSFFVTALILGALALGLIIEMAPVFGAGQDATPALKVELIGWIGWGVALLLVLQLGITALGAALLHARRGVARDAMRALAREFPWVILSRFVLALLAIATLVAYVLPRARCGSHHPLAAQALWVSILLAFASETLGRFLFYGSHRRTGL